MTKKFLEYDFDYLVFDAVTNLLIYWNKELHTKFIVYKVVELE